MYLYVTSMYLYVLVFHSYVSVCFSYATRIYSYVTRMSLVCIRTVLVVLVWRFSHDPSAIPMTSTILHKMISSHSWNDPHPWAIKSSKNSLINLPVCTFSQTFKSRGNLAAWSKNRILNNFFFYEKVNKHFIYINWDLFNRTPTQ